MKVKLHIDDVNSQQEAVLAVKMYYYIDNAMKHPEWLLSEEAKKFDYEVEWNSICNGMIKE